MEVDNTTDHASSQKKVVPYHRPLDRTPEKHFNGKSEENKKLICELRAAKEKASKKFIKLNDEMDARDKELEQERSLRKAVEAQLQAHLTNMYQSPDVNEELRQRLPRANKSDPFKKVVEEDDQTEETSIEEIISIEEDSKSASEPQRPRLKLNMDQLESQIVPNGPTDKDDSKDMTEKDGASEDSSPTKQTPTKQTNGAQGPSTLVPPPLGYYGHAFGSPPYLPYGSTSFSNPLLNSTSIFPQHSPIFRASNPTLLNNPFLGATNLSSSYPLSPPRSVSFAVPLTQPLTTRSASESVLSSANNSDETEKPTAQTSTQDSGIGATGISATASPSQLFSPLRGASYLQQQSPVFNPIVTDPLVPLSSARLLSANHSMEQNARQVQTLLVELDAQKAENKKLSDRLSDSEREVETLKVTLKTREVQLMTTESSATKAADLVEEVYAAQRKRDDSTLGRIRVANQERDEVLQRLREVERKLEEQGFPSVDQAEEDLEDDDAESLHLLLNHLDSAESSDHEGMAFVRRVEAMRHRQREVTNEEMQVILEQRDEALAKCHKLEAELLRYQRQNDSQNKDQSFKAKLATLKQERDMAVQRCRQLEDEIQTLRIYYSLHKSLSQDPQESLLREQASNTVHAFKSQLRAADSEIGGAQAENTHLAEQLRAVTVEKKQLEEALKKVEKAFQGSKEEQEKLQRLVTILRRKLNNLSSKPESDQGQE